MPRPTKLTPQIADLIVNLIEGGVPRRNAARAVNVAPSTLQLWLQKGDNAGRHIDPDDHTITALRQIAQDRNINITGLRTKQQIAEALNDHPDPYSEFSERVRAADSRFMASAIGKMRETGADDWRMWDRLIERRFPELRISTEPDTPDDLEIGGTDIEAEKALQRAEEIKVKMLGTGTNG